MGDDRSPTPEHIWPEFGSVPLAQMRCLTCNTSYRQRKDFSCLLPQQPDGVPKCIYIRVIYFNETQDDIPVTGSWKVDGIKRLLIVGKGLHRIMVPLENIKHFGPIEK